MFLTEDTIISLATAPGLGAVAILRLSGPKTQEIGSKLISKWPKPRQAALREICSLQSERLDEALVLWFPGPKSFTGEDTLEIHTHGGSLIPGRVLRAFLEAGARMAEPGEFSRRAFLNGRLGLDQAEALNDLIHAENEGFANQALHQMQGGLKRKIEGLREQLLDLSALLEANLDFPEDDIPGLERNTLLRDISKIEDSLSQLAESYERGRILRKGLSVALTGRPNVGKSSLLNAFLKEDRAIVTSEAGTTRDVLEESFRFKGNRYRFLDTAGLRDTPSLAEAEGINRAKAASSEAEIRLIVTVSGEPIENSFELFQPLDPKRDFLIRNKSDLVSSEKDTLDDTFQGIPVYWVSAIHADGLDQLLSGLHQKTQSLLGESRASCEDLIVTNVRHRDALKRGSEALKRFVKALRDEIPYDVSLVELYSATDALGTIIGAVGVEDILDRVFEKFCIGK